MLQAWSVAGAGFEAARHLPSSSNAKYRQQHGHSFRVWAQANAPTIDEYGLSAALQRAIAPLDYSALNDTLPQAEDRDIAHYIFDILAQASTVSVHSTRSRSVLVSHTEVLNSLTAGFEAAHSLPHVSVGHQCGRLHGHRFGIRIVAQTQHSHEEMTSAWQPLFNILNQRLLNHLEGLSNPTSEMLALWLYQRLKSTLSGLSWIEVRETATAGSLFDGKDFHIWKEQRVESAVPTGCDGQYTGHSYLIRLMLSGQLDPVMGWILDFGDVKERFTPLYRQLDHAPLDTLAKLQDTDNLSIAHWVYKHLMSEVPALTRVDIYSQEKCGVSLCHVAAHSQLLT